MRKWIPYLLGLTLLVALFSFAPTAFWQTFGIEVDESPKADLVARTPIEPGYISGLVNSERTKAGLEKSVLTEELNKAAQDKAQWLIDNDEYSHRGPDGTQGCLTYVWRYIKQGDFKLCNENLVLIVDKAAGAERIVRAWMNSPKHRASLLDANNLHVGYGVAYSDSDNKNTGTGVVVAIFIQL